jgi:transposase
MSGPRARALVVGRIERHRLAKFVERRHAPLVLVLRGRAILMLGAGHGPASVARYVGLSERNVRKWRSRWEACPRFEALEDLPRSGRPPRIAIATRCEVVKLACSRPSDKRTPFESVWTQQAIADALFAECGERISRSSVQRVLSAKGLRPHRVRQWLHSADPNFREKVARVCELYTRPPPRSIVLCVDEKPMQILKRRYPTKVGPRGVVRREYEYRRGGTCQLLGAYEVGTGRVHGRIVKHRDAKALVAFLDEVVRKYPRRTIYIVWDNLNLHLDGRDARWTRFARRHRGRVHFVHTPLHASWVNQIEIWFSILQRRVIRYGSFEDRAQLCAAVMGFICHWNEKLAHPFRWTFSGRFEETARVA